jgi:hypothetical protein
MGGYNDKAKRQLGIFHEEAMAAKDMTIEDARSSITLERTEGADITFNRGTFDPNKLFANTVFSKRAAVAPVSTAEKTAAVEVVSMTLDDISLDELKLKTVGKDMVPVCEVTRDEIKNNTWHRAIKGNFQTHKEIKNTIEELGKILSDRTSSWSWFDTDTPNGPIPQAMLFAIKILSAAGTVTDSYQAYYLIRYVRYFLKGIIDLPVIENGMFTAGSSADFQSKLAVIDEERLSIIETHFKAEIMVKHAPDLAKKVRQHDSGIRMDLIQVVSTLLHDKPLVNGSSNRDSAYLSARWKEYQKKIADGKLDIYDPEHQLSLTDLMAYIILRRSTAIDDASYQATTETSVANASNDQSSSSASAVKIEEVEDDDDSAIVVPASLPSNHALSVHQQKSITVPTKYGVSYSLDVSSVDPIPVKLTSKEAVLVQTTMADTTARAVLNGPVGMIAGKGYNVNGKLLVELGLLDLNQVTAAGDNALLKHLSTPASRQRLYLALMHESNLGRIPQYLLEYERIQLTEGQSAEGKLLIANFCSFFWVTLIYLMGSSRMQCLDSLAGQTGDLGVFYLAESSTRDSIEMNKDAIASQLSAVNKLSAAIEALTLYHKRYRKDMDPLSFANLKKVATLCRSLKLNLQQMSMAFEDFSVLAQAWTTQTPQALQKIGKTLKEYKAGVERDKQATLHMLKQFQEVPEADDRVARLEQTSNNNANNKGNAIMDIITSASSQTTVSPKTDKPLATTWFSLPTAFSGMLSQRPNLSGDQRLVALARESTVMEQVQIQKNSTKAEEEQRKQEAKQTLGIAGQTLAMLGFN